VDSSCSEVEDLSDAAPGRVKGEDKGDPSVVCKEGLVLDQVEPPPSELPALLDASGIAVGTVNGDSSCSGVEIVTVTSSDRVLGEIEGDPDVAAEDRFVPGEVERPAGLPSLFLHSINLESSSTSGLIVQLCTLLFEGIGILGGGLPSALAVTGATIGR